LAKDLREHLLRLLVQLARRLADDRILEDARVAARELPGLKERRPVDIVDQLRERVVTQDGDAGLARRGRRVALPVDLEAALAGARQGEKRPRALLLAMLRADALVVLAHLGHVALAVLRR